MAQTDNSQVANIVQAMLGSISRNVRAVSLLSDEASVTLHFVLEQDRLEDREEIADMVFEFEALQSSNIDVDVVISVNPGPMTRLDTPGRLVYLRKEP
jgi:hypothetical protein